MTNLKQVFDEIYEERVWGDGIHSPRSGSGSKPENAQTYVKFVQKIINDHGIKSVTDFGHGDWLMWGEYCFDGISYTGIEVSKYAHDVAKKNFGSKERNFIHEDVLASRKIISSELLISKDVLQHLSLQNIKKLLTIISGGDFRFLVLCNDVYVRPTIVGKMRYAFRIRTRIKKILNLDNPFFFVRNRRNNREIVDGDIRGIDLQEPPFRNELTGFRLLSREDYDAPWRDGIKKRIYFYERLN
jgi:hypothetical protein